MSASEHLSEQQFSAYRGLHLGGLATSRFIPPGESHVGIGHHEFHQTDPTDDHAIIQNHLRQLDPERAANPNKDRWSPYGAYWTNDEHTAQRFARDPDAGRYNTGGWPKGRRSYGVVLEAHMDEPPKRTSASYESHVDVPRSKVRGITAHLYSNDGVAQYRGRRGPAWESVRSFKVPEEHWKNA